MLMNKLHNVLKALLIMFLVFGINSANSQESYQKSWTVATIIGSFPNQTNYKYYLEPQIRFIGDPYFFHQLLLLGGLGYQINPNLMIFAGPGWVLTKTQDGTMRHEKRIWEQLNWLALNTSRLTINSRTRLEERKNIDTPSEVAFRLRERVWVRIPFKNCENYSFSCYDEVFFNFNHPQWTSPYFFEQNRAFVGIGRRISKTTIIDVGYLNQYLHSTKNQMDNVLLLSFTVMM